MEQQRKAIAAINMTLDGYCGHTLVQADAALHNFFSEVLRNAGVLLYGRVTFQLMEYWKTLAQQPSGEAWLDDFAAVMDATPKIVFSHTLQSVDWHSARLAGDNLQETVAALKQQPGKNIYVGSPGLIASLLNSNMVDELQLVVHPVIAGSGLPLFKHMHGITQLQLIKSEPLGSGAIVLYYQPANN